MALSAQNVETAKVHNFFMFFAHCGLSGSQRGLPGRFITLWILHGIDALARQIHGRK